MLLTTLLAIPHGTRTVTSQFVILVTYVKYPNLDLIMNNWKRKKYPEKEKDLNWMGHFKIESRYLKLRYDFRAFIRCIKTAWYRLGYLKFLMCLLIKRIVRAFISNIRPSIWTFSPAFEALGRVFETLLGFQRKEKARLKVWKIYAACLCYDTAHTAHLATVMRISWTLIKKEQQWKHL